MFPKSKSHLIGTIPGLEADLISLSITTFIPNSITVLVTWATEITFSSVFRCQSFYGNDTKGRKCNIIKFRKKAFRKN